MTESIYNIFVLYSNDVCSSVGYVVHEHAGTDDEGCEYLKSRVDEDFKVAKVFRLDKPFRRSEYNAKSRIGEGHHLFDGVFSHLNASVAPLFVATSVKDGVVHFDYSFRAGEMDTNEAWKTQGAKGNMPDWLVKYTTESGIDIARLIHDDYFRAMHLTFNAGHYVSAMKLLVSCIDTLAYIEYGDDRSIVPFVKWLDTYAQLTPLGVTSEELWELRNGILHMTNISSKKVRSNKVRCVSFGVGKFLHTANDGQDEIYYFDFHVLIKLFAEAQARWLDTYNHDREKFVKFVERYDETISDSRVAMYFPSQE